MKTAYLRLHEENYQKGVASVFHGMRLNAIRSAIQTHVPPSTTSWADFGCASGFILAEMARQPGLSFSRSVGFDVHEALLERARKKGIPNAEFRRFDLNEASEAKEQFELVTCFETLEHTANYRNAFGNLFHHLRQSGTLIITVPNETGVIGLLKFLRRVPDKDNKYSELFERHSPFRYLAHLLLHKNIEEFRDSDRAHWGTHLGFDYRNLKRHIQTEYVGTGKLRLVMESSVSFLTNVLWIFQK